MIARRALREAFAKAGYRLGRLQPGRRRRLKRILNQPGLGDRPARKIKRPKNKTRFFDRPGGQLAAASIVVLATFAVAKSSSDRLKPEILALAQTVTENAPIVV